jgi:3-methylfumaryl-CoA hydratase
LNATLLAGYAERIAGKPVKLFNYRGVRPALLGATLTLNAVHEGDDLLLWVSLPDGAVSMQARASF